MDHDELHPSPETSHTPDDWIEQFQGILQHMEGERFDSVTLRQLALAVAIGLHSSLEIWRRLKALETSTEQRK